MSNYTKTLPTAAAITAPAPDTRSKSPAPISETQLDHRVTIYKECMKNHAASINGNVVDGCMEYLAAITPVPADPTTIVCAACGCHRNFHRMEDMFVPPPPAPVTQPPQAPIRVSPPSSPFPPPIASSVPDTLIALSNAASAIPAATATPPPPHTGITVTPIPASNYSANTVVPTTPAVTTVPAVNDFTTPSTLTGRRYRTKFTKLQKEKMLRFAEQSDCKIHKRNEEEIKAVCNDIGVDKHALKVWLRNNKSTLAKKDHTSGIASASATPTTTTSAAPKSSSRKKGIKIGGVSSASEESYGDRMV